MRPADRRLEAPLAAALAAALLGLAAAPAPASAQEVESLRITRAEVIAPETRQGLPVFRTANGLRVLLPDGTYQGGRVGASIIVVTGSIVGLAPGEDKEPLEVASVVARDGLLMWIGTNGREIRLPDGEFRNESGAMIVVQNGNVAGLSLPRSR